MAAGAVRFLYFYRVPLPSPRADAIQIIQTCSALVREGAAVTLHVEATGGRSLQEIQAYYGVEDPPAGGAAPLAIRPLGGHWSWPFLRLRTAGIFRPGGGPPSALFIREVRPYAPGLMARARRAGVKTIFEAHNVSASLMREKEAPSPGRGGSGPRTRERQRLEARILALADGLVCTQQATRDQLADLLPKGTPSIVLGNAARPSGGGAEGERDIDILYCGSLKPWKGVDTLVAAMQSLHPWSLTIVGPGTPEDLARLKAMALALGVRERVRLRPPVTPAEVWGLYARARVGVIPLPSGGSVEARSFTSPLKLFEMLSAGLPVVASKLPSLEEYVQHDREALLVPPDDPRFLAYGIKRLLTEEGLASRLAAAGRERAGAFTWDQRARKLIEFAASLLS